MRRWWAENAENREPSTHRDPATFGLDLDQVRPLFAEYVGALEGLDHPLNKGVREQELHFGFFLPQIRLPWPEILARALCAERLGFHSLWLMDHLAAPAAEESDCLEAWTLATALAARSEPIRIGHLVLCNSFRHPALLAKMAATLDRVSGGRLELGLGWGSQPGELSAFGIGEEPPAVRAARLRETIEILRLLFSGERVSYEGRFFRLRNAIARPTPGAAAPADPRRGRGAQAHAADRARARRLVELRLDRSRAARGAAAAGRRRAHLGAAPGRARGERSRARGHSRARGETLRGLGGLVCGTAGEVAAALASEARVGVELFICVFADGGRPETLERFARDMIPAVRALL